MMFVFRRDTIDQSHFVSRFEPKREPFQFPSGRSGDDLNAFRMQFIPSMGLRPGEVRTATLTLDPKALAGAETAKGADDDER